MARAGGTRSAAELFQPMLASAGSGAPPTGKEWVFEPKYDGIRIIAIVMGERVGMITRNGHDKCRQFPEVTAALRDLGKRARSSLVLDGEVVALDANGNPGRFQDLQGRMHLVDDAMVTDLSENAPAAFVAFDILVDGEDLVTDESWDARRKRLERVMRAARSPLLRLSEVSYELPGEMEERAREQRWEGIMAKQRDARYEPGRRVRHWRKHKIESQQELVIGGWTEPRNSRKHFGALLLGYYDDGGHLVYAGHTGTGFSDRMLETVYRKLKASERATSPFVVTPKTNERAHWAEPEYVAEVRFNEWTSGGLMRQPVFLGLRDDKDPHAVRREGTTEMGAKKKSAGTTRRSASKRAKGKPARATKPIRGARPSAALARNAELVAAQLRAAPSAKQAVLRTGPDTTLDITNLGKVFFPVPKVTKGRLMEYYAEISPYLLPALADRPLVLKRYPNGIKADAFYQQKAPDKVPPGIRVEPVADEGITTQRRLIGGDMTTLLYLIQLGAVSTDPWHSRVQSIADADYSIVDLDPGPQATFGRVIKVARWVKEVLDEFGLQAVPKTSGASGIHIVLPLEAGLGYDVSVTLAELVARRVNEKHPKETTVVRAVRSRPADAVYVDYLQNIRGKTVASVYSARAETHASVSTPLNWDEITDDLDPRDFTIANVPARVKRVGDLWAAGMKRVNRLPGIHGDAAA